MGRRIFEFNWSATPLGPLKHWPRSLRTAVHIVLESSHPMAIWLGSDLTQFYNDAYARVILGARHPWALGRPAREVWVEMWSDVGPQVESVIRTGQAVRDEQRLFITERIGFPEETYQTIFYSPIFDEFGRIGAVLCIVTDYTQRIFDQRQLALLHNLMERTTGARTWRDVCRLSARALETNSHDFPFALIYLIDPDQRRAFLAETAGIARGHQMAPEFVNLDADAVWPFTEVLKTGGLCLVSDLESSTDSLPTGAWQRPPTQAVALPIAQLGSTGRAGILITGLNPFRLFDSNYQHFIELVSAQISAAIAQAQAYEEESSRASYVVTSKALDEAPLVGAALRWVPHGDGRREKTAEQERQALPSASALSSRPRILIADDHPDSLEYLYQLLSQKYEVMIAIDGEAALAASREQKPDLVISDVMMPGLDGINLVREVRANPQTQTISIILLSGLTDEESRVKGLEAGADDYLIKPFGARELLARVGGTLTLSKVRREAARREAELRAEVINVLESMTDGFMALDCEWRITYVNAAAEQINGRTRESFLGRTIWEAFPDLPATIVELEFRRAMANRVPVKFENFYAPYGRWYEMDIYPIKDGGIAVYGRDITERKRVEEALRQAREELELEVQERMGDLRQANANLRGEIVMRERIEAALRESEERFRALIDASAQAVWTTDAVGIVVEDSPSWRAFTGQTLDEWLGRGWLDAVHPEDRESACNQWQEAVASRTPVNTEFRLRHASGGWRWTTMRAVPLVNPDRSVRGWVGMNIDITERKEAEEERRQLLGRIVETQEEERRRISRELHDHFGQQLTVLRLGVEALQGHDPAQLDERVKELREMIKRLDTEVDFLAWELRPAALDEFGLASALAVFVEQWSKQFNIVAELHTTGLDEDRLPPEIEISIYRIAQEALNNVSKHAQANRVAVILESRDGSVVLIIEDDGVGFELQQDATPSASGRGLGLIGMRERAALIGGMLEVESSQGGGTTIFTRIPLPAAAQR